jgi:hypothetical protein
MRCGGAPMAPGTARVRGTAARRSPARVGSAAAIEAPPAVAAATNPARSQARLPRKLTPDRRWLRSRGGMNAAILPSFRKSPLTLRIQLSGGPCRRTFGQAPGAPALRAAGARPWMFNQLPVCEVFHRKNLSWHRAQDHRAQQGRCAGRCSPAASASGDTRTSRVCRLRGWQPRCRVWSATACCSAYERASTFVPGQP